jgi:cell division transport system ATP-binding protein
VLAGGAADLPSTRWNSAVLHDILRATAGAGQDHRCKSPLPGRQSYGKQECTDLGKAPGVRWAERGNRLEAITEFASVGLRYGTGAEVLRDLDFKLGSGGFYFLTGPSGAGKTSLLKLLYLAQRPTRGRIRLFGEDLSEAPRETLPPFRRRIGVVFQDFRLVRHLSAFDNVALPLRVAGASEEEAEGPVREMLAWVGLADRASARPAILSGGEQQRVAIARAVINRPELLVADEPTGNVDAEMANRLMHLFTALNRLGTTVVVATHDLGLIGATPGAELIRLENGSLVDPTGSLRNPPPGRT